MSLSLYMEDSKKKRCARGMFSYTRAVRSSHITNEQLYLLKNN